MTAESFIAQLNKSNNIPGFGVSPNLNLTAANEWKGVPFQARIFNRNLVYAKVEDGKLVNMDSGEFHDMTKLGEAAFAPPK